jgi:hypothetical protein
MPATKIDLSAQNADAVAQLKGAQTFRDAAGNAAKAADKAALALPSASLASSEASNAMGIYTEIGKQQDAVLAMGGDPSVIFGGLLTFAAMLVQSAKDRLIDAGTASA